MSPDFKPPRRTPSRRSHLERLAQEYGRAHSLAIERTRRWLSIVSFASALEAVQVDDGARFLIKGGTSMELRLGAGARTTRDVDLIFRGDPEEMLDALEEAFERPYGGFSFRHKGEVEDIRDTGSRIADFGLDGPSRVACLSLRFQVAQKLHAVTEQPEDRENLRFWDLIDLILLRELLDEEDLGAVREACVMTFATRGMHAWPAELVVPESWAGPYAAAIADIDRAPPGSAEAAADEVRTFIAEIDAAGGRT